ncbi:MAG TPA: hypothetical protein VGP44_03055 [Gemmatimonadales bacterium]|nr:hypothetical protein [Gemmatimonadales bacterium]
MTEHPTFSIWSLALLVLLASPACAGAQRDPFTTGASGTTPVADSSKSPIPILPTGRISGQTVAILPITLVVADPALHTDPVYASYVDRPAALARADSLVSEGLVGRSPEVNWIAPRDLRKMARRSAGYLVDPDQMGQAVLRAPKLLVVPDPLRSSIRSLMAVANGRLVLVPAAIGFGPEADGQIRADLSLVLADARTGKVVWRSLAYGRGKSPDEALNAALAAVLPLDGGK